MSWTLHGLQQMRRPALALALLVLPEPSLGAGLASQLDPGLLQALNSAKTAEAAAQAAAEVAFAIPDTGQGTQADSAALETQSIPVAHATQGAAVQFLEGEQLRRENDRLRRRSTELTEDVSRLRHEGLLREAQWHEERERLIREDSELRREDAQLRREDMGLRQAFTGMSPAKTAAVPRSLALMLSGERRVKFHKGAIIAIGSLITAIGCLCLLNNCFRRLPADRKAYDESEDEEDLRAMIEQSDATMWNCLRCFCTPYMCCFSCGTIFVSFITACVLWELGLLQPILGQCMVYIYIVGIIAIFFTVLVYEVWILVARGIRVMLNKINHPLKRVFGYHRHEARRADAFHRSKFLHDFTDGETNPSMKSDPGHWGDAQRRRDLWKSHPGRGSNSMFS